MTDTYEEERTKRNKYWSRLKRAFDDFQKENNSVDLEMFKKYMIDRYGLQVNMLGWSISGTFNVVDESRYLMFLLKYQ